MRKPWDTGSRHPKVFHEIDEHRFGRNVPVRAEGSKHEHRGSPFDTSLKKQLSWINDFKHLRLVLVGCIAMPKAGRTSLRANRKVKVASRNNEHHLHEQSTV